MSGAVDKVKGKANELAGKARGKKTQEVKGKAQQGKGRVKDEFKEAKERTERDV